MDSKIVIYELDSSSSSDRLLTLGTILTQLTSYAHAHILCSYQAKERGSETVSYA